MKYAEYEREIWEAYDLAARARKIMNDVYTREVMDRDEKIFISPIGMNSDTVDLLLEYIDKLKVIVDDLDGALATTKDLPEMFAGKHPSLRGPRPEDFIKRKY